MNANTRSATLPSTTTPTAASFNRIIAPRERPARASALSATLSFGWRGLLRIKHVPEELLHVVAIPIVFTVMFTYLFGGALDTSTGSYLQFILPGTLVMAVLLVTMYSGSGLNADLSNGVFDRFRSLPIWQPSPIVGAVIGDLGRYLTSTLIVLALGFAIGFRATGGVVGVIAAVALVLLFSFSLSWLWTTLGLVMRTADAVMSVSTITIFPLTLASNLFVDPATMPGWLHAFVKVNPVTHLITVSRDLMLTGSASTAELAWVLASSLILIALFVPLTIMLYRRRSI
ncbi:MAG TPA: ABC transporter permease [Nitrolancea sp.]|nr:ABC transporter permease [Nitrolancea sp.]